MLHQYVKSWCFIQFDLLQNTKWSKNNFIFNCRRCLKVSRCNMSKSIRNKETHIQLNVSALPLPLAASPFVFGLECWFSASNIEQKKQKKLHSDIIFQNMIMNFIFSRWLPLFPRFFLLVTEAAGFSTGGLEASTLPGLPESSEPLSFLRCCLFSRLLTLVSHAPIRSTDVKQQGLVMQLHPSIRGSLF